MKTLPKIDTKFFLIFITCIISISLVHLTYAQTQIDSESQVTLSENMLNDPIAQDLLKKIEQTRKMIEELKQKEFEENQAKVNLQKMRDISVDRLDQNLSEWERLWEKHSSRNSFESFVSNKPSFVHGVFWDQFEFKEQKVNAGRSAMNKVLTDGGTMQDARKAYDKAAATLRVELIEINSQINVKHNLASHEEQQLFNSTGQYHQSSLIKAKMASLYSDYQTQPSYILANLDNPEAKKLNSNLNLDLQCIEGFILVSKLTTGNQSCVEESMAKKWMNSGIKGIVIEGENSSDNDDVEINPATQCKEGYQVVYNITNAEYQCMLESNARQMLDQNIAENHTLIDYIAKKDEQKTYEGIIYNINQKIFEINKEFDIKNKQLESKYKEIIKNSNLFDKQEIQKFVEDYKIGNISKEEIDKQISKIREVSNGLKEKIFDEKKEEFKIIESEKIEQILNTVRGYEENSDIDFDWNYLNKTKDNIQVTNKEITKQPIKIIISDKDDKVNIGKIDVVNSFGYSFEEIKTKQVLQITADITNPSEQEQNFAYVVEITDDQNRHVQPTKWATGTLNPTQTFNVGLSWIPEDKGEYKAFLFIGNDINSVLQVANIEISVNPDGDISDDSYCKNSSVLLFKYSDNSPICVASDTASKLINKGLAFA